MHPLREISRKRFVETVEDVAYVKRRIKQFTREGAEHWGEIEIPEVVERKVQLEEIEYVCDQCDERKTIKIEIGALQ